MDKPLTGKVAVVTGAGRNIGREEALALARAGANVLVNDLLDAEGTVQLIREMGGQAVANAASASSWAGGEAIVAAALKAFGRIDILVNNAGVASPRPIEQMTEEEWDAVVNVSLKGYAATIRFAAPHFIAQRSGIIVNTGSVSGLGHLTMANYAAAKEGAAALTRTVARELGQYGIRCNLIRPMTPVTGMNMPELRQASTRSNELGFPVVGTRHPNYSPEAVMPLGQHVAALVLLLCLPATAQISGQDFYISGDEVARVREPELICMQFQPGGWTIEALQRPKVLENLLGDIRNRYVR